MEAERWSSGRTEPLNLIENEDENEDEDDRGPDEEKACSLWRGNLLAQIRRTARAVEPAAGKSVADNFFFRWIPFDRATETFGDPVEMADGRRAMADFRGTNRS